ncbi:MAG: 3-oxoacyl-ACP reductase, partial [Acidiphilium sp.]
MASEPSCLIIGASRGLGLAMAEEYLGRGWRATVRGAGPTGLHALAARAGGRLAIERLDINDADQLAALRARLEGQVF